MPLMFTNKMCMSVKWGTDTENIKGQKIKSNLMTNGTKTVENLT